MPLSGFIFGGIRLILPLFSQNIKVFKMPLSKFIFGGGLLILSLLPQNACLFCLKSIQVFKMSFSQDLYLAAVI